MGLLAACNGNSTSGNNSDGGGSGGDGGGSGGDGGGGGGGDGGANGPPIAVTVSRTGTGTGTVTSLPGGIDCGGAGSCTAMFPSGNVLTLTAKGTGSSFSGWTGACAGQSAVCQLVPSGDITTSASFDPLTCTTDFICWEAPLPFGMDLSDVTAVAANDVWAVGSQGSVVHYDGTLWKLVSSGTLQDLTGVSASSSSNIWISGGDGGLVLKGNGSTFSPVSTGNSVRTTGIYTTGPNQVFVATDSPNVMRYNGTWNTDDSKSRSVGKLIGISGSSGSNVWVYGSDNTLSRYNGSSWTVSNRNFTPTGIFATGASDGYMVNFDNKMYKNSGTDFTVVSGPAGATGLAGIWGTSASNIFTSGPTGALYRYDGSQWTTIQTSAKEVYAYAKGAGVAANDMWAVGQRGVIAHWDGTTATSRRANVFTGDVNSVWGSGTNDVWFSTKNKTVVHYNGIAYTESAPLVTGAGANVYGLGGSGPNDIWLGASENSNAVLLHYNGSTWSRATLPQLFIDGKDTGIILVWAASATSAWALGATFPFPLHWDGSTWQVDLTEGVSGFPTGLWGATANDLWMAANANDSLYHYTGGAWVLNTMLKVPLYSLSGFSASDVWAGGDKVVYHWNGSSWSSAMAVPGALGTIVGIAATAANDVWFTDSTGLVFRYTGTFKTINTTLGSVKTPTFTWAANANNVWFGGRGILSYRR